MFSQKAKSPKGESYDEVISIRYFPKDQRLDLIRYPPTEGEIEEEDIFIEGIETIKDKVKDSLHTVNVELKRGQPVVEWMSSGWFWKVTINGPHATLEYWDG